MTRVPARPTFPLLLAGALALLPPTAGALEPPPPAPVPDLAAAAAAGPASTAAYGARCIGPAHDDTPAFQAAIDTGHTVYAPAMGGHCHITHPLVMRTPGQIFGGDGRARTRIEIQPGFTGEGVFVAKTGGPGPSFRDFAISFEQPDTDNSERLFNFPAAFTLNNTPNFIIDSVGCFAATICIAMAGNSGNSVIRALQFDAFQTGIEIDGSLDTVRVIDPHWWPFALSKKQRSIFDGDAGICPTGIRSKRLDDLVVRGGLFGGCLGLALDHGKFGSTSGSIEGTVFDTFSGVRMTDGQLTISTSSFSPSRPGSQAFYIEKGSVTIVASHFFVGGDLRKPMVESVSSLAVTISASTFMGGGRDVIAFEQHGGLATITNCSIAREAGITYRNPFIRLLGGQTNIIGNMSSSTTNASQMIADERRQSSGNIALNVFPGWTIPEK